MNDATKKQRVNSLLGLSLDGGRLEGVVLRRTNGSVVVQKTFSTALSLDPLTNEPELVGQEIRNHLEKAGIRERRCAVCVPLNWALMLQTKLPEMSEEDAKNFLQIEAERGFPYGPEALLIASSRFRTASGEQYATQVAIPRDHIVRLETALKSARLKPVTFGLGVAALQSPAKDGGAGVVTLFVGENSVWLQVSCGGGVAALRTLEGTVETEAGQKQLYSDLVARELRITLGQLPADVRDIVRQLRVFGQGNLPQQLVEELRPRAESAGIKVTQVGTYPADEFGVKVPPELAVSPAFSLAARHLVGRSTGFEFLPPKVSAWKQFAARHSSRKLVLVTAVAGAAALLVVGFFIYQQWQLSTLQSQWKEMSPKVAELENLQQQIRRFRPWFDDSLGNLNILRHLTEAFPEEGTVWAKTVEIRDLANVTCTGTANERSLLYKIRDQLQANREVGDVHIEHTTKARTRAAPGDRERENRDTSVQFTFNFHWGERTSNERQ